jgi:hypothetical protein
MQMKSTFKRILITIFVFMANIVSAQTIETNIPGLVIKDYRCYQFSGKGWVDGNLINRNAESFIGALRVKIIDKENDIIWQGAQKLNVGAQNGAKFDIGVVVGNCLAPNKVQITLER